MARDIGKHEAQIEALQQDVHAMREDLTEIKALLNQTKGGMRVLIGVGSIGGAVGAALVKFIAMLKGA
ncbi:MAG TPA: hypothetical protein PLX85_00010 [Dehalococcoidia bacterium]|nr:hypothetical protein [Dehalococcoidia bacterium]